MEKLIGMTDFVLEQWYPENLEKEEFEDVYYKIHKYANFLKQPLELWMLVPCDKYGNPYKYDDNTGHNAYDREYREAKERCLFANLSADKVNDYYFIERDKKYVFALGLDNLRIVEDLVKYNLQLTPTAQKQIGI